MDLHSATMSRLAGALPLHPRLDALVRRAASAAPARTVVVMPTDELSIEAAVEATIAGLIEPILVGPRDAIAAAAARAGLDIGGYRIVEADDARQAAAMAVAMARDGGAAMLMKGALHTDDLMHAVVSAAGGLRTSRRISHSFIMDVPHFPRLVIVTDAAVNIAPTLMEKRDIIQNAIDLAHVLGIKLPRVAVLAATETVNPDMLTTVEAAALSKMADRGQITGGLVDGPLALDNAVDLEAARVKGIVSPVAGLADILLVPGLEAGNMVAKDLTFMAGAGAAGVVTGARVPIVLTSRADSPEARKSSCAVAALMAQAAAGAAFRDAA